ncbi:MAG: hypothetical protein KBD25_01645 [Rickettsiaceae bacterium]|jgi:hypothetical protein|nr:hypothetical protein [Candidatus Megaera polyxenophila]MBP9777869.1 hypothetical protein [Rickettsiaceae bacterium]MCC8461137.1 hypothetical protein [Candidatus Megaera polyxenophila]BBB56515.1 glycosyltransferase [Candidatus Megaera polyxenophila]
MLNKAVIFVLSIFLLSSCATGPEGYFKKSANNKLFDTKGAKGGKRAPLYNKKYITKAKQNVANNDYADEDDEYDDLLENENISQANKDMYRSILEQELESKYIGKKPKEKQNKTYPVLVRNSPRADDRYLEDNSALRAELDQIKTMLNETKNEMANYRCPTAQELEKAQTSSRSSGKNTDNRSENSETGSKQKSKSISPAKIPDPSNEADTTESVKSI